MISSIESLIRPTKPIGRKKIIGLHLFEFMGTGAGDCEDYA